MLRLTCKVLLPRIRISIFCLPLVAMTAVDQENPNFSGTYALTALKSEYTAQTFLKDTLKVTQNAGTLEIVESHDDGNP